MHHRDSKLWNTLGPLSDKCYAISKFLLYICLSIDLCDIYDPTPLMKSNEDNLVIPQKIAFNDLSKANTKQIRPSIIYQKLNSYSKTYDQIITANIYPNFCYNSKVFLLYASLSIKRVLSLLKTPCTFAT